MTYLIRKLCLLATLFFFVQLIDGVKISQKNPQFIQNKSKLKSIGYVLKKQGKFVITEVIAKKLDLEPFKEWTAKALYTNQTYNTTGWSILEIETNENVRDQEQAFSAGYLEGFLSRDMITLHLLNNVGDFCKNETETCKKLLEFLTSNFKWISSQIKENQNDPYWHQVNLIFHQFYGLYHGYYNIEANINQHQNVLDYIIGDIRPYLNLIALQLNGDMSEVLASLFSISNPFIAGSCSALIKILPNNKDLFVSQITWTNFESMLRILKHYRFHYHFTDKDSRLVPGQNITFSSYPGILNSIDDFYLTNAELAVIETTIGNSNTDLWKYVTPFTNLYWIRIAVANRMSSSGAEWAKWFSMFNSGTYNNEWMIVDYKKFIPGQPLKDGVLTVLEQLPGQIVWDDKTSTLVSQSYWPSYNLAYYPEIYNISGTYDAFLKYGSFFSYENSSRANIFRRDHSKVIDMDSMIKMMRYNNFKNDPLSRCDCDPPYSGENTIAARSDLNPSSGTYPFEALGHRDHGATDMKVTSSEMVKLLEFIAIGGPTHSEEYNIPVFVWSEADFGNTTNHFGHPDRWNFDRIQVHWQL